MALCIIVLSSAAGINALQIPAFVINDDNSKWVVDISNFVKANPEYADNNHVQFVNDSECLYARF